MGYLRCIKMGDLNALQRSKINNKDNKEIAFITACKYGQLNIAKWLINDYPNINIHVYNDKAFKRSCYNEHFEIVQWLIEYANSIRSPIDIHAQNERAIKLSFSNGQYHVTKWLIKTFDGYDTTRFSEKEMAFYNKHKIIK